MAGQRADAAPKPTKRSKVAKKDPLIPDIGPVAPLPTVFRKIKLISAPNHARVTILNGTKTLPCAPANRTPCTFQAEGYTKVVLDIIVRFKGQELRYRREVKGRSIQTDLWLLKIPKVRRPSAILVPRSIPTPPRRRPKPNKPKAGVPVWIWVVGGVVVAGAVAGGVGYALSTRNQIALRLSVSGP